MKTINIIYTCFFAISFSQCVSQKFENNPPFTIKSAIYKNVTGGRAGNNSLDIHLTFSSKKKIEFDKLYFQNRITKAVIEIKSGVKYIMGRYNTSPQNPRFLFDKATLESKEIKNGKQEKFPFELKENEAILSYKEHGTIKFYKISSLKKDRHVMMQ
ncbi:hypothetical protein [Tenacibaculum sp. C7A-26P2]|uniref:hypothetical protein n=1 Tax=Tenacibaculum sp. C7A-26P2 TaxID=3447504 RepID=UPI003F868FF8